jgi:hypothetical protein
MAFYSLLPAVDNTWEATMIQLWPRTHVLKDDEKQDFPKSL